MRDFEIGREYAGPPERSFVWFYEVLGEVRRSRIGDVPLSIRLVGMDATGPRQLLEGVDPGTADNAFGCIQVSDADGYWGIPCDDIAAFTLLPDAPIDHRDELRA